MAGSLVVAATKDEWANRRSGYGSVIVRNLYGLSAPFVFKPEFEDLAITKFIKALPLTNIIGARCVSLDPGTFAAIHTDSNGDTLPNNHLWENGFVNLSLNISDGGVPLFYALPHEPERARFANDPLFMLNDFYLHGVPLTTSRRRQIRITGRPTEGFEALVDREGMLLES
jgi:hypothetical protein